MPLSSLKARITKAIALSAEAVTRNVAIAWQPRVDTPQELAFNSEAKEIFFGGIAGAGKSDLLLGLAFTSHRESIIYRREYPQLAGLIKRATQIVGDRSLYNKTEKVWSLGDRFLEFGAVQHADDVDKFQGRPHDFIGFDEITHFDYEQYTFLTGWLRTTQPNQRCRIVATGNPPSSTQGRWVIQHWGAWLDPHYTQRTGKRRAEPGEVRYFIDTDGETKEVDSPDPIVIESPTGDAIAVEPISRTFIPGKMIPDLVSTGYASQLFALPEPLRSQLLYGDFSITADDDRWQVIPSAWVRAAQDRWFERKTTRLKCIGVDVARGGKDQTILAKRYDNWVAKLIKHPGSTTPNGQAVAGLILAELLPRAYVAIDIIGVGSSPYDILKSMKIKTFPLDARQSSKELTIEGTMGFANKRSQWWWQMRELLDPKNGHNISLPKDEELLSDLTAPRWTPTERTDEKGVKRVFVRVESKEDLMKRLGRSPDCGDAVVYCFAKVEDKVEDYLRLV